MAEQQSDRGSPLLSLPPELRNRIYRNVLVESNPIITWPAEPAPKEPSLLAVCRQIRKEATSIFYLENVFEFNLANMDASIYRAWCCGWEHDLKYQCRTQFHFLHLRANWSNLVDWMEDYFHTRCNRLRYDTAQPSRVRAIAHLFRLTRRLRRSGVSWEEAKKQLEVVHRVLGCENGTWRSGYGY